MAYINDTVKTDNSTPGTPLSQQGFIADSADDVSDIIVNHLLMGSSCKTIQDGKTYILDSDGTWYNAADPTDTIAGKMYSVILSGTDTLQPNEEAMLTATVIPDDAIPQWSTSDADVVSISPVNAFCNITGVAEGTATITAKIKIGMEEISDTLTITVAEVIVPDITITSGPGNPHVGESGTLEAVTVPEGQTVTWTTDDAAIIDVYEDTWTATGEGTAIITASMTYEGETYTASAECVVTAAPQVSLSYFNNKFLIGETATLEADTIPDGQTVTWSGSDDTVFTVGESTGILTAIGAGDATVEASMTYEGETYSSGPYDITVTTTPEITLYPVSSTVGDVSTATVITVPAGVAYTLTSSDPDIISVTDNSVCTCVAPGTATLTAAMEYGGQTYTSTQTIIVERC